MCPAGSPIGQTKCDEDNPCQFGHECVRDASTSYCCPNEGKPTVQHLLIKGCDSFRIAATVCTMFVDNGVPCASTNNNQQTRFYFDMASGTCRQFQFTGCGGNANNFQTLNQCDSFCVSSASIATKLLTHHSVIKREIITKVV